MHVVPHTLRTRRPAQHPWLVDVVCLNLVFGYPEVVVVELPDAVTVTELVAAYEDQGYATSFTAEPDATVRCAGCRTASKADEVAIEAISRAEGPSDPADMAMVAALRCPWCQAAGVLVVGYGPLASAEDAEVVCCLSDDRERGARLWSRT